MDELYNEVCDIIQEQYDCGDLTEEDATTLMEAAYDRYVVEGTNGRKMAAYRRLENDNRNRYGSNSEAKFKLGRYARSKKHDGKFLAYNTAVSRELGFEHEELAKIYKNSGSFAKKRVDDAISKLSPSKGKARKNKKEFLKTLPRSSKDNTKSKQLPAVVDKSANNTKGSKEMTLNDALKDYRRGPSFNGKPIKLNQENIGTDKKASSAPKISSKSQPNITSSEPKKRVLHTRDASTIRKMNNTLPYKKDGNKSFTFNKPFGKMKSSKKINIK